MKLKDFENYVSQIQVNPDKDFFCCEYQTMMERIESVFQDPEIQMELDSFEVSYEAEMGWRSAIETKFEQRWKTLFYREYNDSLKAFDGATCPIGAHIYYWCCKQVATILLRDDAEKYSCGNDVIELDDVIERKYRQRLSPIMKTPLELFCWINGATTYCYDHSQDRESQWRNNTAIESCLHFHYNPLKRLFVEIMIEYIDIFRDYYSGYLPASFLDASNKEAESLKEILKSLSN